MIKFYGYNLTIINNNPNENTVKLSIIMEFLEINLEDAIYKKKFGPINI